MAISQKDIEYINKMGLKSLNEYEQTLLEYEVKNKADYSDYKEVVAKRRAVLEVREEKFAEEAAARLEKEREEALAFAQMPINARFDLSKLDAHLKVPRKVETEFVQHEVKQYWLKKAITREMTESPIIYMAIVQVDPVVFAPMQDPKEEFDTYAAVFVYAKDDKHRFDSAYLLALADKIFDMRSSHIPADCAEMMKLIMRDRGSLHYKVGASVAGDGDAWATVQMIDRRELVDGFLGKKEIVPYLMTDYNKPRKSGKGSPSFIQIDKKFYQK